MMNYNIDERIDTLILKILDSLLLPLSTEEDHE